MKLPILRILLLLAVACPVGFAREQYAVMVGPLFHWYFSGQGVKKSLSLEVSLWRFLDSQPTGLGADVGWEHEFGGPTRVYGELQGSVATVTNQSPRMFGGSLGPVLELGKAGRAYGVQGSLWGPFPLLLGDLRFRTGKGLANAFGVGLFTKVPVYFNHATQMLKM